MNGENAGKSGKIVAIDLNKLKVAIENIQVTKKDGSKANLYFNPSKLMITELNLEDKMRTESINKTSTKKETKEKKK